ncbi:hypothetical protein EW026_g2708 [Hermanssonia centrifuga]|uniref:O-methyltransferase dimerisation domain-containing protein n=1 Tax=Hermanssonia centrifuga TaxID=98765 RepID=A0A4S4KMD7_9APHY|nr:hypothetical protein EW026_g2708 [Hermanssonia centrifuga]
MSDNNAQDTVKELRALSQLINASIDEIEHAMVSRGQSFPLLNESYSLESEIPRMEPDMVAAGTVITSAAAQLIAAVRIPAVSALVTALQYEVSSSLRGVIQAHVPEILREAGVKGLHVSDIAASTKVDPSRLARILRLLATNHIFTEVSPDVFAHNRTVNDAMFRKSNGPDKTAFNLALKTNLTYFSYLELPENAYAHRRFNASMNGVHNMVPPGTMLEGFDWNSLRPQSNVVDVGSGIGSQSLALAETFPHLNFILQDSQATLENALTFWKAEFPEAISTGRVKMQDEHAIKILCRLRAAAGPDTQLVVIDSILSFACPENDIVKNIPGAAGPLPPPPLLPNLGYAGVPSYLSDISMMNAHDGVERTIVQFNKIFEESGWKISRVHRGVLGIASTITGVPA